MGAAGAAADTMSGSSTTARERLHFLDGIRGLAALYVLLFHSLTISVPQEGQALSAPMRALREVFGHGHFAVAVFIVLSGFSLMLPLARHSSEELRRGFRPYLWRRCRRVMPPYYAALVLSIVAIIASDVLPGVEREPDALSTGSVLSHLFLVHNLEADWVFRINGPMWSVATEFQIYFLFPLVLLPLWRRAGPGPTIALAWLTALAIHFGLPADQNFSWAAPWFVGSFAMGMWGAQLAVDPRLGQRWLSAVRWGWLALGSLGVLVLVLAAGGRTWPLPYLDAIVSVLAVGWILACVRRHVAARGTSRLNAVLGSPQLVLLGSFSYSLYLLQHPLLRLTEAVLGRTSLGFEAILWTQLLVGTPLIMFASWLFAEVFELPLTTGSRLLAAWRRRTAEVPAATFDRDPGRLPG